MADRYLTSPGHAIAERARWQKRMTEEMRFIALDHPRARWSTLVNRMARQIHDFPDWGRTYMLGIDPDDPEDIIDRLGRTLSTFAYNNHVLFRLVEEGLPLKMWMTRRDAKVRETHKAADGQKVPIGRPFLVGGSMLQVPADSRTAPPDVWMGCRCIVLGRTR